MKKLLALFTLIAVCFSLTACGCEHNWVDATCQSPKYCSLCGKTDGKSNLSQHSWKEATCVAPKTCAVCGVSEGSASLGHVFEGDKCKDCGLIILTMDNYEDYIDCSATVKVGNSYYTSDYGYIYTSVKCVFEAKGNTHYKYNDVSFMVKFYHYDRDGYDQYLLNNIKMMTGKPVTEEAVPYDDATDIVYLNLAGDGSGMCELSTPWSSEKSAYSNTKAIFDRTTYEIVNVIGTVQEY